ncbi:non-homologous end-joining factor 1 [Gouania willdenowi]|uniref:Non-homologous end-joining factor 1 n=1 Tax=Gouania willdenowi TaxID=441366 RepID=A0A8C5DEG0_GOUWI|nr:non-homologous end-joining factor 1 [Gouania willdenowi]
MEAVLTHLPWVPVSLGGRSLLVKSCFADTTYRILLTDLHCVWEETMSAVAIQSRAQALNKRLQASVGAFFSHLCAMVQPVFSGEKPDSESRISLIQHQDDKVTVKLRSELAGLPFYWEFYCSPAPISSVCAELVRPLLTMSRLLQQHVEQLRGLLVRKDAEIQDYKENGASLSRERLRTDVFDEQTNTEDFMAKVLPVLCTEQQNALGFDGILQHLYAAIMTEGSSRKRKLSEERCDEVPANEKTNSTLAADSGPESVCRESEDKKPNDNHQCDDAHKIDDKTAPQQARPLKSECVERQSSKPKKKKVGLFR